MCLKCLLWNAYTVDKPAAHPHILVNSPGTYSITKLWLNFQRPPKEPHLPKNPSCRTDGWGAHSIVVAIGNYGWKLNIYLGSRSSAQSCTLRCFHRIVAKFRLTPKVFIARWRIILMFIYEYADVAFFLLFIYYLFIFSF